MDHKFPSLYSRFRCGHGPYHIPFGNVRAQKITGRFLKYLVFQQQTETFWPEQLSDIKAKSFPVTSLFIVFVRQEATSEDPRPASASCHTKFCATTGHFSVKH